MTEFVVPRSMPTALPMTTPFRRKLTGPMLLGGAGPRHPVNTCFSTDFECRRRGTSKNRQSGRQKSAPGSPPGPTCDLVAVLLGRDLVGEDVDLLDLWLGEEDTGVGSEGLAHAAGEVGVPGFVVGKHVVHAEGRGAE